MNITIVTAAWNADNLPKVSESIDEQDYQDFQWIMVNDNNPKIRDIFRTLPVCNDIHWIDLGVRTHYYGAIARNIGAMTAFSYLPEKVRDIENEWIVFHDDDNLWQPHHLQSMIDTAKANPEATIIASDAVWVGAEDRGWREVRECKLKHGGCDLGQFMYKTSLFKKYGYFDPHPHSKHKYDWRLIKKMTDGEVGKIAYTHKPTFIMNYKRQ